MSKKAKKKSKPKDLDPKAAAGKVKAGSPMLHDSGTYRGLDPIRKLTPDISPPR